MAIDFSALLQKDNTRVALPMPADYDMFTVLERSMAARRAAEAANAPRHRGAMPDPVVAWEETLRARGIEPGPAIPPRHKGVMPKKVEEIDPATAWENLLRSQGIEPGPAVAPRPQLSSHSPREVTPPQPTVEMRAPEAVAGPSAAALGELAGFDFAAARAEDLRSRIAALDQQFPVRSDKRYTMGDLQPSGPGFASMGKYKGTGYQELRNPVTGAQGWAPPGAGQSMVNAANKMVMAKAQARGDLIRGYSVEDAMVNALAEAAGIDPEMVRGMGVQQAQAVLGPLAQNAERDRRAAEDTTRRASVQDALGRADPDAARMVEGVPAVQDAMSVFDRVRRALLEQKEQEAEQERVRRQGENQGKLAEAAQKLYQMDPDEAIRAAPALLGPLAVPGGPAYNAIIGDLESRSMARRQTALAGQRDQQARQREIRVSERKQQADVTKRVGDVLGTLRKVTSAAPKIKRVKGDGLGAEEKDDVQWGETVSEQYASLINAIHEAEAMMPGSTGDIGAATIEAPFSDFWHPDSPEKSSHDLKQRANEIMRAIAEAQKQAGRG